MAGYGSKINFNDGEAVLKEDLDSLQDLERRRFIDEFLAQFAGADDVDTTGAGSFAGAVSTSSLRPLRRALCPRVAATGLVIDFDSGLVVQRTIAADLSDAALVPENAVAYTNALQLTLGVADATNWRRDVVQARIASVDEATVSRDFKDAITGALSTQSVVKRTNLVVELQVKAGTLEASQASADDPSNEVAVDPGWFKVCSVLVPPTDTDLDQDNMWDWRKPWGIGSSVAMANNWLLDPADTWTIDANTGQLSGTGADFATLHPMHLGGHPMTFVAESSTTVEDHRRVSLMEMRGSFSALPLTSSALQYNWKTGPGTAFPALAAILTGAEQDQVLYLSDDGTRTGGALLSNSPPLWANGRKSPALRGGGVINGESDMLRYTLSTAVASTVSIRSFYTTFWGGI